MVRARVRRVAARLCRRDAGKGRRVAPARWVPPENRDSFTVEGDNDQAVAFDGARVEGREPVAHGGQLVVDQVSLGIG